MVFLLPSSVPPGFEHLDDQELELLERLHEHVEAGRYQEAQDAAEDLWRLATDAHKRLWQGVSNALTAVCARELGHLKGAREIADATREILQAYPRQAAGLDLVRLVETMNDFVAAGKGQIQIRS